jgi:DNA-binding transcriptional LysR family regulator
MIEQLEALAALAREGTMGKAGARLRISQSAVSKRIATLEGHLRRKLIEPQGRRVILTLAGVRLLQRVGPLLDELRGALTEEEASGGGHLVLGVSESVLASWGAGLLGRVRDGAEGLSLELHAHRSPVVLERVRSGEYLLGICAGLKAPEPEFRGVFLLEEPMVLVPSGLGKLRMLPGHQVPVVTIEPHSFSWASLEERAAALGLTPESTLESFFAVAQAAVAGFGHGLVPLGVARSLGIADRFLVALPEPGLARPVHLVGRSRSLVRPAVQCFLGLLQAVVEDHRGELIFPRSSGAEAGF